MDYGLLKGKLLNTLKALIKSSVKVEVQVDILDGKEVASFPNPIALERRLQYVL